MQTGPCTIGSIKLFDRNNKTYELEGSKDGLLKDQEIPDGEEIIGIYGNNRSYPQIVNFGFITVSYQRQALQEQLDADSNQLDADSNYSQFD